ncbi:MAG: pyroglutamyl-peptidase I [Acidiferrobacterales bacterium]|nr:pyroglutamyl-peptidase I [Acidiferrobacterales bacterium]
MRILVFGFEKFGELSCNPSQLVVEQLAREQETYSGSPLITSVLPTEYVASEKAIKSLIRDNHPTIVVGLGVSASRQTICLERFALNIDDVEVADNVGCLRLGERISTTGPAALTTDVDLQPIVAELIDHGIAATISNHAGTYVCNHVYYQALHAIQAEKIDSRCVFVHVPGLGNPIPSSANTRETWKLQKLVKAVKLVITELIKLDNRTLGQSQKSEN